tara:strand:+ start:318 stop:818 length:501 start_codon:yes stop_codon:yes gene_type:complete
MSENSTVRELTTYDYTKNITDIQINPSFIIGLQNITSVFMLNATEEDKLKIPGAMKKFETIMAYDPKSGNPLPAVELDSYEQNLYVLFGLVNYLKFEAERQGITIKKEIEVDNDLFESAQNSIKNGVMNGDLVNQLTELGNKFSNLKEVLEEVEPIMKVVKDDKSS